jgi:hypothetical protein
MYSNDTDTDVSNDTDTATDTATDMAIHTHTHTHSVFTIGRRSASGATGARELKGLRSLLMSRSLCIR